MSDLSDLARLNPQSRKMTIGIRKLYEVEVYPLSFGDQLKVSDAIAEVAQNFATAGQNMTNASVITFAIKTIADRIEEVIKLCTDQERIKEVLADARVESIPYLLTNEQVVGLAEVIYFENFERAIKKGKDLFEKIKSQFLSERSLPVSSELSPNTDLMTSSGKLS